jgi:predicted RNase H-like HicB family nuclease
MKPRIYGYYFRIIVEKGESGYVAYAPGVGGVYEEGATPEEAEANAYEAACAILETRWECKDPITEDNEHLKVLNAPPHRTYIDTITSIPDGYFAQVPCFV